MIEDRVGFKPLSVLLIGPLPPPIGGGQTVFQYIVEDLKKDKRCNIKVINTSRKTDNETLFVNIKESFKVLAKLIRLIRSVDVISFHGSNRGIFLFGPFIFMICRLFRKPSVFRIFGGAFDRFYEGKSKLTKLMLRRTVLSADACLFQTKRLVNYFRNVKSENTIWFSNYTRNIPSLPVKLERKVCKRYVFLGRIVKEKGIDLLLDAVPLLSDEVQIDLWGPLCNGYTRDEISVRGNGKVRYCGIMTKGEVFNKLWEYDSVIFPTLFTTEGYPGAILDGFSHGLPVITTKMGSIPEIVDNTCGLFIESFDSKEVARIVNFLHDNHEFFDKLRYGSFKRAQSFSDLQWSEFFFQLLQRVVNKS